MKKMERITVIEDAQIVAWLSLKKHRIHAKHRSDGRIIFEIKGDIDADLRDLYANTQIGVLDYLKALKAIKSQIFTLKGPRGETK